VHCPECVREGQAGTPRRAPRILSTLGRRGSQPIVTYAIIAVCVLVFALQNLPNSPVTTYGAYRPALTELLPWTMITSIFLHGSILHILFNMYSLFVFGPILEQHLGRARFLALYLLAGFGGSVAVLLLNPQGAVLGASGAIFGLMSAFFVIQRGVGRNNVQILLVIGLNLVLGFILPGVSWQAHVGGLVVGALVALIYSRTKNMRQRNLQVLLVAVLAVVLVGITAIRTLAG
jgi:membrane associated rhomboid family serine protease